MTGGLSFSTNQTAEGCQFSSGQSTRLIFVYLKAEPPTCTREKGIKGSGTVRNERGQCSLHSRQMSGGDPGEEHEVTRTVWFCRCPLWQVQKRTGWPQLWPHPRPHSPPCSCEGVNSLDFGKHRQEQHSIVLTCRRQAGCVLLPRPHWQVQSTTQLKHAHELQT